MSSKEAGNDPELCPVTGQKSGLCSWTRARDQCSSLSLGTKRQREREEICSTKLGWCTVKHNLYRAFHNVLRDYKHL